MVIGLSASPNGESQIVLPGRFRWTRAGLRGLDYGGNEISTGQGDADTADP